MMPVISNNPVLITYPPSLDCELARFLLKHYGIEYREEPHAFFFCFFFTLWHAGTVIFPLVYSDSFKLVGPRAMAEYFDPKSAPIARLFPQGASEKRQVDSDWILFNQTLAFATARFAYYHLLPSRGAMIRPLSLGTPNFEMKTVEVAYPIYAGALRILLGLSAQKAQDSLDQIRNVFDTVDARLAVQKSFLVGDGLTLSDLAFAVAAAPLVLPPAYGGRIPSFEEMPAPMQNAIAEMRARPAGAFALRIYDQEPIVSLQMSPISPV
jgi:glutathione S-transferase